MAHMKEKIKKFFTLVANAWSASFHGKLGVILLVFALFVFLRMFWGTVNIQSFFINMWHLNNEQHDLELQRANLSQLERHNQLLQANSPDYIEEIGLQTLNIGDSKTRILKF
ncbi:MAG: hypothetical protein KBS86_02430 [Proteobacteria bacterium]|nr:hypothetical protein [Candidatus Enterousia scatequi]